MVAKILLILWGAYNGFLSLTTETEEGRDPVRVMISLIVTAIYFTMLHFAGVLNIFGNGC